MGEPVFESKKCRRMVLRTLGGDPVPAQSRADCLGHPRSAPGPQGRQHRMSWNGTREDTPTGRTTKKVDVSQVLVH